MNDSLLHFFFFLSFMTEEEMEEGGGGRRRRRRRRQLPNLESKLATSDKSSRVSNSVLLEGKGTHFPAKYREFEFRLSIIKCKSINPLLPGRSPFKMIATRLPNEHWHQLN